MTYEKNENYYERTRIEPEIWTDSSTKSRKIDPENLPFIHSVKKSPQKSIGRYSTTLRLPSTGSTAYEYEKKNNKHNNSCDF